MLSVIGEQFMEFLQSRKRRFNREASELRGISWSATVEINFRELIIPVDADIPSEWCNSNASEAFETAIETEKSVLSGILWLLYECLSF
jgi:hypothetical protein